MGNYNTVLGFNMKIQTEYDEKEFDMLEWKREKCIMGRAEAKQEIESGRLYCINKDEKREGNKIYVCQEPEGFCPAVCASFYNGNGAFLFTYPWNGVEGVYSRKLKKFVIGLPEPFTEMKDITIESIQIGTSKGFFRPQINIIANGTNSKGKFSTKGTFDWHGEKLAKTFENEF